jgi:hypothetical protein
MAHVLERLHYALDVIPMCVRWYVALFAEPPQALFVACATFASPQKRTSVG